MKRFICIILSLLFVTGGMISAGAKVVFEFGDWTLQKAQQNTTLYAIDSYKGTDADVTIPDKYGGYRIIEIAPYAFLNNEVIEKLTFSNYILTVCNYAFIGATGVKEIVLTSKVSEIGENAFSGTTNLKKINLGDTTVTEIKTSAFERCGITEIALPETCTSIGQMAFYNCASLEKITIPDSVTEIADNAFSGCEKLVIYGTKDSCAIAYAKEKGIAYVETDADPNPTTPTTPTEPTTPTPVTVTYLCGDSDGDGEVTILDATKIQRLLAELETDDDGMIALRGDSNGDGLDILDATTIQRYLAEYAVECPIGETLTKQLDA